MKQMKISPSILLARATKFCNKSSPTLVNRFNWFRKDLHIIQLNICSDCFRMVLLF